MALDIDIDFGMDNLGDKAKDLLVDFAEDLGLDKVLRKFNNEDTPTTTTPTTGKKERDDVTPSFWIDNKKWIIPTGIGTGVLAVLGIAMAATKKK